MDSTITGVHQHGVTLSRVRHAIQGAWPNYENPREQEPDDHAIGKSRGGMTCKIHLVANGKGRPLGLVLTGGHAPDGNLLQTTLETIGVRDGGPGRPRTRPDRVLADNAYTAKPTATT